MQNGSMGGTQAWPPPGYIHYRRYRPMHLNFGRQIYRSELTARGTRPNATRGRRTGKGMDSPVPAQAESERDRLAEAVAHSDETQRAVDEEARRPNLRRS